MARPEDGIMVMADNVEELYTAKIRMFDSWLEQGDAWNEIKALEQAVRLASRFASHLEESGMVTGKYRIADKSEAGEQMLKEYEEYRDYAIKAIAERQRKAVPPTPMDAGDVEHAQKYEALAQTIGLDALRGLMPASPERIRKALETGDVHLNTIPLYKWDDAGLAIQRPGLSMSEKVSVLKHVAKWHYA